MHPGRIIDISVNLGSENADYPGDPPFRVQWLSRLEDGAQCSLSHLSLTPHAGTHIDAPGHIIARGADIASLPPERFILPALVAAAPGPAIGAGDLAGLEPPRGGALLLRTANSGGLAVSGVYDPAYAHLTPRGAAACLEMGVSLVGVDYLSVDPPDGDLPAHRALLSAGVLILEGLNLAQAPPGPYTLICLPLKMGGLEASPVRAVLLAP